MMAACWRRDPVVGAGAHPVPAPGLHGPRPGRGRRPLLLERPRRNRIHSPGVAWRNDGGIEPHATLIDDATGSTPTARHPPWAMQARPQRRPTADYCVSNAANHLTCLVSTERARSSPQNGPRSVRRCGEAPAVPWPRGRRTPGWVSWGVVMSIWTTMAGSTQRPPERRCLRWATRTSLVTPLPAHVALARQEGRLVDGLGGGSSPTWA